MANRPDDHDERESKRILARVDSQEGNLLGRAAQRLDNHLNASDAPQDDPVEVWGTRIGRTIALAFTLMVIAYALVWLFSSRG